MRTQFKLAVLLLSALAQHPTFTHAQGSLTPPGAPGPTMKTLAQIEPRTPISSAPFTISDPGSYYLTTNLTVSGGDAITIATNGVTLDLNGFTISSTAPTATGAGVMINNGLRDLAISNGSIRGGVTNNGSGVYSGSGFAHGIFNSVGVPNTRVRGVSVSGCLGYGIHIGTGNSTVVEFCTVRTVGGHGIVASVITASAASDCGGDGIFGEQVSDSRGEVTGSGTGVRALNTAQNCFGSSGGSGTGLFAQQAQNCQGSSNSGVGLSAGTALNCSGRSVGSTGLFANNAQNCFGSSTSAIGLSAEVAQNCYATSGGSSAIALYAWKIAIGSFGGNTSSGVGLYAIIANSCYGSSVGGTAVIATHKYNMP